MNDFEKDLDQQVKYTKTGYEYAARDWSTFVDFADWKKLQQHFNLYRNIDSALNASVMDAIILVPSN